MSTFEEEVRAYRPQEGVDFIYDPYALAGVDDRQASAEEIARSITEQMRQWHSDGLDNRAEAIRAPAARRSQLIGWAKTILLDAERRLAYDETLAEWEAAGRPVSKDGMPIEVVGAAMRTVMSRRGPEEVEAILDAQDVQAEKVYKSDNEAFELHNDLYERELATGGPNVTRLRRLLEADLLAMDGALAVAEERRTMLLGMPPVHSYVVAPGHAHEIGRGIEAARENVVAEHQRRVLGGVSARLALMAGENDREKSGAGSEIMVSTGLLPAYFDSQAEQIVGIATRRERILARRLQIFEPEYPDEESQPVALPAFVMCVVDRDDPDIRGWCQYRFDPATLSVTTRAVEGELLETLEAGDFAQVFAAGFNVVRYRQLDHIDALVLQNEACRKYLLKYYPDRVEELKAKYHW